MMEYFILSQDRRYRRIPVMQEFDQVRIHRDLKPDSAYKIPDISVYFANDERRQDFTDVLDYQLFMASREVKKVFQMYEPQMRFKMICVINQKTEEIGEYYAPVFSEIDCLSVKSELNLDKSVIIRPVLRQEIIGEHAIFRLAGLRTEAAIVRLDVAESLLRRKTSGMCLRRVETE